MVSNSRKKATSRRSCRRQRWLAGVG